MLDASEVYGSHKLMFRYGAQDDRSSGACPIQYDIREQYSGQFLGIDHDGVRMSLGQNWVLLGQHSRDCQYVQHEVTGWHGMDRKPGIVCSLSLASLIGLFACGPMPADPAPSLELRTSLSGASAPHSVSQNSQSSMTEWRQERVQESVVVPGGLNNEASSEHDDGSPVSVTEQLEYEAEQEERSGEQEN